MSDFQAVADRVEIEALRGSLKDKPELLALLPDVQIYHNAVRYALNQWEALTRFLEDGDLEIDNGATERANRGIAIGRNNWTFFGSDQGAGVSVDGGRTWSETALVQTKDGKVHLTYTWNRKRIKHAVLDLGRDLASQALFVFAPDITGTPIASRGGCAVVGWRCGCAASCARAPPASASSRASATNLMRPGPARAVPRLRARCRSGRVRRTPPGRARSPDRG